MNLSDDFREEVRRGFVIYPLKVTQEELEFLEFVANLYNVAEDAVPDFFERLLKRMKKLLQEMNQDLQLMLAKGAEKNND